MIPGQRNTRKGLLERYHLVSQTDTEIRIDAAVSHDQERWIRVEKCRRRENDWFEMVECIPGEAVRPPPAPEAA